MRHAEEAEPKDGHMQYMGAKRLSTQVFMWVPPERKEGRTRNYKLQGILQIIGI